MISFKVTIVWITLANLGVERAAMPELGLTGNSYKATQMA